MDDRRTFLTGLLIGLTGGAILGVAGTLLLAPDRAPVDTPATERRVADESPDAPTTNVGSSSDDEGSTPAPDDDSDDAPSDEASHPTADADAPETEEAKALALAARIDRLARAVKAAPKDADAIRDYVREMRDANRSAEAVAFFEKLLAEDPKNVEAMVGLGVAAMNESGRLSGQGAAGMMEAGRFAFRAHDILGEALAIDENHEEARLQRALLGVYAPSFLGWRGDAEKDLGHLIEQQRGRAVDDGAAPFYHLAVLYRRTDRANEAKRIVEDGLARYPNDPGLRRQLEALRSGSD